MPEQAPCPKCASTDAKTVGFTWWGGILGPRLLSHVKCRECGTAYNGKTGKSNNSAIAIYMGVSFAVVLALIILVAMMNAK